MGRPKLPEEDVKVTYPLKLPKYAIELLDKIAEAWGASIGKEVKRGTIAREMVLIGLGVFMTLKHQKIFAEFRQEVADAEDLQLRLMEISATADDIFTESQAQNIDPDTTEKIIMANLQAAREALFNGRMPADKSSTGLSEPGPTIPLRGTPAKKGGKP